jgi:hypothetical protein
MKKNLIFLAAAALVCGFSAGAQDYNWDKPSGLCRVIECRISGTEEPKVAIDPILTGDKKPKNCSVSNFDSSGGMREELKAFSLIVYPRLKGNEWVTATFSFRVRSRRKGRIRLSIFAGENYAHKPKELPDVVFMGIAQVSSPQISFPNGGYFGTPNLKPWGFKDKITNKNLMPTIDTDDTLSTPGKKFLRLRQPLVHYIDVKPNQEFTITFTVKPLEYFPALH